MVDRIRFDIENGKVQVRTDPFFRDDFVVFRRSGDAVEVLARNLKKMAVENDLHIYDRAKNLIYVVVQNEATVSVICEELSLDNLLSLGFSESALADMIREKKSILKRIL